MDRRTSDEVLLEHLDLKGKKVADVGCGDGAIARVMAGAGATVTAIDVKEDAIEKARAKPPVGGETFLIASAEDMPFDDASQDIVVFHNSLHHVQAEKHDVAIEQANRVLVPGGVLYFSEPTPDGPRFELTQILKDESGIRDSAYRAIKAARRLGLEETEEFTFVRERRFADFDAFRADSTKTEKSRRRFDQPIRVNILRKPA